MDGPEKSVRDATQPPVMAPAASELSRDLPSLQIFKTNLDKKIGNHWGQVGKYEGTVRVGGE